MPSVVFMPNAASPDLCALFSDPDSWATERSRLSGFGFYSYHIEDEPRSPAGLNTFEALSRVAAFKSVRDWKLRTRLEMGAVKEWDCTGEKNARSLRAYVDRIDQAGGSLDEVAIDEPLASTIRGAHPRDYEMCFSPAEVHLCAQATARFVKEARRLGVRVNLTEAYPQHPAERIIAFLRHIVEDEHARLDAFVLDYDPYAVRDQNRTPHVERDLAALLGACRELGLAFGVVATELRATNAADYCLKTKTNLDELLRLIQPDEITVQSWLNVGGRLELPHNLPVTDPNSHLALVRHVAETAGA